MDSYSVAVFKKQIIEVNAGARNEDVSQIAVVFIRAAGADDDCLRFLKVRLHKDLRSKPFARIQLRAVDSPQAQRLADFHIKPNEIGNREYR